MSLVSLLLSALIQCFHRPSNVGARLQSCFDSKNVSKVTLDDFRNYDIVVSSSPLYSNINDDFFHTNHLIDLVYKRLSWKDLIYTIIRESANLSYARLRISPNQLAAKAEFTYLIREARDCGLSLGLDTLKYTSVDIDIRSVLDYLILKSQGVLGFPGDLQWLYGYFAPHIVRNMPAKYFCMVTRAGALGLGYFPEVPWHKREKENILRAVGLKVEHGNQVDYGESRGMYKTVGDQEHSDIIDNYFEGLSMGKIAKKLDRSAATVHAQIHAHNESIDKTGYCLNAGASKGHMRLTKQTAALHKSLRDFDTRAWDKTLPPNPN